MIRTTFTYVPAVRTMSFRASASAWTRFVTSGSGVRPIAFAGLDELERQHQPEAADVADRGVLRGERAEAGQELGAALAGVRDEALILDHVERRVRRRAGDDVAAVRSAVGAGRQRGRSSRAAR